MRPETALLLAVPTLLIAVAVMVGTGVIVVFAGRARSSLREHKDEAVPTAAHVSRQAADLRARLTRATEELERLSREGAAQGARMETWTAVLAQRRGGLEHLTRGRLTPAVRLLRVAGLAARVAILWR